MRSYFGILLLVIWCSCTKEELPVKRHDPGAVITTEVNMTSNYKWQIYYDLKTNTVVGQNLKTIWDLGFETSADGYHVVLNTSKSMFARNMGAVDFATVTDTNGFSQNKKWDEPSGNFDSTAIGDWRNTNNVYIIDRGYNEIGKHQGLRKIQFLSVDQTSYTIRYAQLNGIGETTLTMVKDSLYNFSFFSFGSTQPVKAEPPKKNWDLCFTQYLHVFYNPINPYLVTGCLLNRYKTEAVMDSIVLFTDISISMAQYRVLRSNINVIGYDWKTYVGSTYTTNTKMNYIIKDMDGYFYKLHFIDFYNSTGAKGNPKWEYQQL